MSTSHPRHRARMLYTSVPVETASLPFCSSHLPVRIHRDKDEIQRFALEFVNATQKRDSKVHESASSRNGGGPDLNFYSLVWNEADLDKVKHVIEFSEFMWSHDDVVEEEPLDKAISAGQEVRRAMSGKYDDVAGMDNQFRSRIQRFSDVCRRMKAINALGWQVVKDATEEWLLINTKLEGCGSLEEYLILRNIEVGNNVIIGLIRWSREFHVTEEELDRVRYYTDAIGIFVGLTNDYVSWKRERTQPTDRVANIVHFLMKKHDLPEDIAISAARGILLEQERRVLEMSKDLHSKADISAGLMAYVDHLQHYAGGVSKTLRFLTFFLPNVVSVSWRN